MSLEAALQARKAWEAGKQRCRASARIRMLGEGGSIGSAYLLGELDLTLQAGGTQQGVYPANLFPEGSTVVTWGGRKADLVGWGWRRGGLDTVAVERA